MIFKKSLAVPLSIAILAAVGSGTTFAAKQGELGEISEGNVDVKIRKEAAVRISKLDDIDFGVHSVMSGDWFLTEEFCVFSSTGAYRVTLGGSNSGISSSATLTTAANTTGYTMVSGSNSLPYQVFYGGSNAGPGEELSGLIGDQVDENCANGNNAELTVKVAAADFNSAAPGDYSDTLNILVRPE